MISVGILVVCAANFCLGLYETVKRFCQDADNVLARNFTPGDADAFATAVYDKLNKNGLLPKQNNSLLAMEEGLASIANSDQILSGSSSRLVDNQNE